MIEGVWCSVGAQQSDSLSKLRGLTLYGTKCWYLSPLGFIP